MTLAVYLLAIAGFFMFLNLKTKSSRFAQYLTYYGMWAAIIGSIILAINSQLG